MEFISREGIERQNEALFVRFLTNEPHRVDGHEPSWSDAHEPSKRLAFKLRRPESLIVVGIGIRSLPLVAVVAVGTFLVGVGKIIRVNPERRSDGERGRQTRHHSDASHVLKE